ncbi:MAG: DUF3160 domain-containing protein [Labilithrix sp.]|nr:DUF3160 domain-containing protein [Labilithrix sp.]MCW5810144.1 DUF3160 domain-containing protein [Labilithrix sp.]
MKARQIALLALVVACGGTAAVKKDAPGTSVTTEVPQARRQGLAELQAKLDEVKDLDAAGFAARYALPYQTSLGYEPLKAGGLDRVKASSFALQPGEEDALAKNGFVVAGRKKFPSFIYGYQSIYSDDLPVYVSADSILYAVHQSYDAILKRIEARALLPALTRLVSNMQRALAAGAANAYPADVRADVDLYLAVARGLLDGQASGSNAKANELVKKALAAAGQDDVVLFGKTRTEDFSQFEPRGHYTESPELGRYFRATMWLGRVDFRILETQPDHTQVFNRRQLEGAYALRAVMDASAIEDWKLIDRTVGAFVGEPDNMTLPQLDALLADLKSASGAELSKLEDGAIAQAVSNGGYGAQRISSHIMINGLRSGTMPLSSTFLLLGQRYVVDSHVFSNVVYDRVNRPNVPQRMLPNPLDVAFAALGNDQAGQLLGDELGKYQYAPDLASMRVLVDAHPSDYWEANLYNEWLGMVRTLSPTKETVADPSAAGMPRVTGTEPWGRRILSTQLASWAELRHDTLLYVKQSYTAGNACEFPDAYVEPYPELFTRLASFAAKGDAVTASFDIPEVKAYFERLREAATVLEAMARNQRAGTPHTTEQLAFINQMTFSMGCGTLEAWDGWYAKLFFEHRKAAELDPTIVDVHTQPTDESGNVVGKVLHVGTTMPRAMVVAVESCSGPRAYVGLVSSYHETVTEQYKRLTDEEWKKNLFQSPPAEVGWFDDLVAR